MWIKPRGQRSVAGEHGDEGVRPVRCERAQGGKARGHPGEWTSEWGIFKNANDAGGNLNVWRCNHCDGGAGSHGRHLRERAVK